MNQSAMLCELWPLKVNTKIVGTTFEGRQELLAECRRQGVKQLKLVPDPMNKYDPCAVGVETEIQDNDGRPKTIRLGFLSNSDRVCSDCGKVVGGALFEKSKTVQCPSCCKGFGYDDRVIYQGTDGETAIECPRCGNDVDLHANKLVVCPSCGGTDFGRAGLATRFFRALAAGVQYRVCVADYTGGDIGPDGKRKSLGCNIRIERVANK